MENQKKWYDNKGILILLLFLLPPIAIYGIFMRKSLLWKKLIFLFIGLFFSLFLFGISLSFFITPETTIDRQLKTTSTFTKIDTTKSNLITDNEWKYKNIEDIKKLIQFQKDWANDILKSESKKGNERLSNIKLSLPDTILFEYTEDFTKFGYNHNFSQDTALYRKKYNKLLIQKFKNEFKGKPIFISVIPNQEYISKNNSIQYEHPSLAYYGVKVYSGNQFHKEYVGAISCFLLDKELVVDGVNKRFVLVKKGGSIKKIPFWKYRSHYWIKAKDNDPTKRIKNCF